MFEVRKAKRSRRPLKISFEGLSGSGKTFSALRLAFAMRRAGIGRRIVVADSENESAGLYDGITIDGETWEYDHCPITPQYQTPDGYRQVYEHLHGQGFDIIIIDSMTHAWKGALARVDEIAARNKGDKFGAGWRAVTPEQERMMQTLTDTRAHLITTTRVKGEYERTETSAGKDRIRKIGTKADQRDGLEYEYDVVIRMDTDEHLAVVEKVRGCTTMDGKAAKCPGPDFWRPLFDWWLSAAPVVTEAERLTRLLQSASTLPDLAAAWKMLSPSQQVLMLAAKDARKAELTAQATPAPEPTPQPQADRPEMESNPHRDEVMMQLAEVARSLSISPDTVVDRFWRAAGLARVSPKPPIPTLTTAELEAIVEEAEAELERIVSAAER